jgi:phosphatidate cytidylyltransferase
MGRIDIAYKKITGLHKIAIMISGWCFMFLVFAFMYGLLRDDLYDIIGYTAIGLFAFCIAGDLIARRFTLRNLMISLLGLIYISVSLTLMIALRGKTDFHSNGINYSAPSAYFLPALLIASIWINDTMAYIVGSLIGRTPFSPISPKKTWEGTIGGILLSVAVCGSIGYFFLNTGAFTVQICMIALIASVTGTIGDLVESSLKRLAGVKDSGRIMPGHGGFLDRFDSLLVAIPFVWLYARFFL